MHNPLDRSWSKILGLDRNLYIFWRQTFLDILHIVCSELTCQYGHLIYENITKTNSEHYKMNQFWSSICRYFQCRPKYGLFAPVHKVAKVHTQASNLAESARSRRSNSSSSLSSIGSRNYGLNASSGSIMTSKSSELRKVGGSGRGFCQSYQGSKTRKCHSL